VSASQQAVTILALPDALHCDSVFHARASMMQGGQVMRAPNTSEASMARVNGVLIRTAIVVALASALVLPLALR
jgi:hypothetical protein